MRTLRALAVCGWFAALTVLMTWPIAAHIGDEAVSHQDVYFNMWRLEWFAHALVTPGAHVFDANIFYPERDTFAYSDAMLVEDVIAAPLYWLHVAPVLVHNLLLLGAIALSGAAMFALAWHLTRSRAAAMLAGIVFAFAPYRFEHLMHMELQWTMWSPLAFLFLHRTLESGRWRDGIATGASLALQMLSSIYYGVFLALLTAVAAVLLLPRDRRAPLRSVARALAAGGVVAIVAVGLYARPYAAAHARVGDRPVGDIISFSALPSSYVAAPPENRLYGRFDPPRNGMERRLLPGLIAVLLALLGLLLIRPPTWTVVYLVLLAIAFELSLGLGGVSYRFLYDHAAMFRGFRAMARVGMFVLLFVAVLAAHGYRTLASGLGPGPRRVLAGALAALMLFEYRSDVVLMAYPNEPTGVYRVLARQPRGVVAEFPMPQADALPGAEAEHAYMSTFHWFPLVNGYSGNYPPSYLAMIDRLSGFPDAASMRQLHADGVRYIVVHTSQYEADDLARVESGLRDLGTIELGSFDDGNGTAILYVLGGT
ncbi:MAG: hypothetical protein ACRD1V_20430 [Vicinamibacterales bacterium]